MSKVKVALSKATETKKNQAVQAVNANEVQ